jgi:prepilin-type N-terminal cleavage/methylation domain-containing protein
MGFIRFMKYTCTNLEPPEACHPAADSQRGRNPYYFWYFFFGVLLDTLVSTQFCLDGNYRNERLFRRKLVRAAGDAMQTTRAAGFTLIEVVIVIAIISAAVITILPMQQWLNRQGVRHAVEQLQSDLQLSRVTAIRNKETCCVRFDSPASNQYYIESVNRRCDLAVYRGNVHFLKQGPDGKKMAGEVRFNCRGMSTTVAPADVFLTDGSGSAVYRIQVKLPGGISVHLWRNEHWQ